MSPVAQSRSHAGRALALAGLAVVLAVAIAFAVALLASRGKVEVRLGTDTFSQQNAKTAARQVAEGGPLIFADTAGGDRDIVLQHLGNDPETGWIALAARPPGVSRGCTIQSRDRHTSFRLLDASGHVSGACDGREFPPDGAGLPTYPVSVRDGKLDVDLNAAARATSTTR